MSTLLVSLSSNVNIKSPDVSIMGPATSTKGGGGGRGGAYEKQGGFTTGPTVHAMLPVYMFGETGAAVVVFFH